VESRFGWLGTPAERLDPVAPLVRVLWRMRGPKRMVTAALHRHPAGTELRVYFEPESAGDLLESQVEHVDISVLVQRAAALQRILLEKGWRDVT
jgi:hypothetical protein